MYVCEDCGHEFEEPERIVYADPEWPWEREWRDCCPKCESTDITEVFYVGDCIKGDC